MEILNFREDEVYYEQGKVGEFVAGDQLGMMADYRQISIEECEGTYSVWAHVGQVSTNGEHFACDGWYEIAEVLTEIYATKAEAIDAAKDLIRTKNLTSN